MRIGRGDKRSGFAHKKAALLALFVALLITAVPYLRLGLRVEMRVLCWFPGWIVVAAIWQVVSNVPGCDEGGCSETFNLLAQLVNVVLYTTFFYVSFRVVSKGTKGTGKKTVPLRTPD